MMCILFLPQINVSFEVRYESPEGLAMDWTEETFSKPQKRGVDNLMYDADDFEGFWEDEEGRLSSSKKFSGSKMSLSSTKR